MPSTSSPRSPVLPLSSTVLKPYDSIALSLSNGPALPPNPPVNINNSQYSYLPIHSTLQFPSTKSSALAPAPAPPPPPPLIPRPPHAPPPPLRPVLPVEQIPLPPPRETNSIPSNHEVNKNILIAQKDAEINMPRVIEIQTLKSVPTSIAAIQKSHPNKENNDRLQLPDNRIDIVEKQKMSFTNTEIENEIKKSNQSGKFPHAPDAFLAGTATSSSSISSHPSVTSASVTAIAKNVNRDSSTFTVFPPPPPLPTITTTSSSPPSSSLALVSVTPAPIPRPSVNQYYIARFEVPR